MLPRIQRTVRQSGWLPRTRVSDAMRWLEREPSQYGDHPDLRTDVRTHARREQIYERRSGTRSNQKNRDTSEHFQSRRQLDWCILCSYRPCVPHLLNCACKGVYARCGLASCMA